MPRCLEPRDLLVVVEVVDDLVAALERGRHVEPADRLRCAGDAPRLGQHLAGPQQRLGRHAAVERALAADEVLLDDGDLEAGFGQAPRAHLPGRPGTDDHDVEAALAHGAQSIPVRPALQGRGILRGCSARSSRSLSSPRRCSRPAVRTRTPATADTTTNATASTNDDTGGSSPAEGRAAAGRGVRLVKVGDFQAPVYLTSPPGDKRRLFIVEQAGQIVVVRGGKPLAQPFLDIRSKVTAGGEQGLLSVAFPPDYAQSGSFYVYYTEKSGSEAIWEYHRAGEDRANPNSARLVLRMDDPEPNHNGGLMIFGPDKLMYVGTGDGGGANDQHGTRGNAQSLGSPLGKILRIDPRQSGGKPYTIPSSNPFVGRSGARGEIYSYGLRNPWRFSFDSATGDLTHRRRRAGPGRGDRLRQEGRARAARTSAGARGRAAGATSTSRRRTRSSPSSRTPTRPASARSRAASSRATAACPASTGATSTATTATAACAWPPCAPAGAPEPDAVGASRLGRRVVRRGRLGAALRGLGQRAGLPLRGPLTGRSAARWHDPAGEREA